MQLTLPEELHAHHPNIRIQEHQLPGPCYMKKNAKTKNAKTKTVSMPDKDNYALEFLLNKFHLHYVIDNLS